MTANNQTPKSSSSTSKDVDNKDKNQSSTGKQEHHDTKKQDSNPSKQASK